MNFKNLISNLDHGIGAPIFLVLILCMLVVPLPPFLLDLLFSFNITLSLIIILAVIYVARPLELGMFPTVLLLVTLLRLSLNVASTRVVLLHGHEGTDAAGKVIESFGEFVIGGNYTIGLVVFSILVIINFVVVTKGAGRVSEVTARFTLDAMPGKQMGIDADLNAGVIDQDEAARRRNEIREEADFFGSMDGASKFVRGDAVAGVLILLINIIGGLAIGTIQHDMSFGDAMRNYALLTIGDGLVAQIPSLLLSTGTAIIVTRMSAPQDMGEQVINQLFRNPKVLGISAGVLTLLGLIPEMPHVVFLSIGALGFAAAYRASRAADETGPEPEPEPQEPARPEQLTWNTLGPIDALGLDVGYRLIPLVDPDQNGELNSRILSQRKRLSQDLGFLIPTIHIRDQPDLPTTGYRISLHGVPIAESEIYPGRNLAINSGQVGGKPVGIETKDPTFGLEAFWIEPAHTEHARTLGYTVADASTVVATHLSDLIKTHAYQLLGHEEAQQLLDRLTEHGPQALKDLVPKVVPLATVVRVLQDLLIEQVPIKNIRTIVETLAEQAPNNPDPGTLLAAVRVALSNSIVYKINGLDPEIPAFTLDPKLEQILQASVEHRQQPVTPAPGMQQESAPPTQSPLRPDGLGIEPGLADQIHQALLQQTERQEMAGEAAVLLVPPSIRSWLARFVRQGIPRLNVLAYNEIPDDRKVRLVAAIGS